MLYPDFFSPLGGVITHIRSILILLSLLRFVSEIMPNTQYGLVILSFVIHIFIVLNKNRHKTQLVVSYDGFRHKTQLVVSYDGFCSIKYRYSTTEWFASNFIKGYIYRSMNEIVAQLKNCLFLVNTTIEFKSITTVRQYRHTS
jgi:hypothetical protein